MRACSAWVENSSGHVLHLDERTGTFETYYIYVWTDIHCTSANLSACVSEKYVLMEVQELNHDPANYMYNGVSRTGTKKHINKVCVIEQGTHVNKSGYCGLVPCCAMSQGEVFVLLPILRAF